ncbi:hypothetical protein [Streptomyces sp. NPDC054975]
MAGFWSVASNSGISVPAAAHRPPDKEPVPLGIERPILHAQIDIDHAAPGRVLLIITVHLKSRSRPTSPAR